MKTGERIGPLRVERALGVGGMGEVYLARDERLERLVAVKLLPATRSLDPDARGRMLREARAASALNHPGIVTVYDVGDHDGRAFIVMEFVDGETFDAMVARRGRLAPVEAVGLLGQVVDAVAAAHDAGVLHRDLKSANLMIDGTGRVKVLDFGLSKRTDAPDSLPPTSSNSAASWGQDDAVAATLTPATGAVSATDATAAPTASEPRGDEPQTVHGARMGTPGWAPPELIDGRPADVRSDVFALGCVLYHLLTGSLPFPGTTWAVLREQIERGAPPPSRRVPAIPPALDAVVLAALAADPVQRPASARALLAAAGAAIRPRRRIGVAIAVGGAVAVAGATAIYLTAGSGARATSAVADAGPAVPAPPPVPRPLTSLGGCAYSPTFVDDDTVAFDLTRAGAVDLYRVDLGGGPPVQITSTPGWEWRASRGASDHELVFLVQAEAVGATDTVDLPTGSRRRLIDRNGAIVHAGDAYYYAPYMVNELRRLAGDRDEVLLALPAGVAIDTLVASDDGARLGATVVGGDAPRRACTIELTDPALVCLDAPVGDGRVAFGASDRELYLDVQGGIARARPGASRPEVVIPDVDARGGIAVSPSGATLVYSSCRGRSELVSVLDDPAAPILDDRQVGKLALGADGALVYARKEDDGTASLMVRLPDAPLRQVLRVEGSLLDLSLSASGNAVVYALGGSEDAGIYLLSLSGTNSPNRLTESDADRSPVFAGDDVAFVRWTADHSPRLMRVAPDGQGETQVSKRPRLIAAADPTHARLLLADPGSPYFYWWSTETGREERGPPSVVSSPSTVVALSPDGRWLLTLGGNNGQEVWRQDLAADAKAERVFSVREDRSTNGGAIDDRGRPLVAIGSWEGELFEVTAAPNAPW